MLEQNLLQGGEGIDFAVVDLPALLLHSPTEGPDREEKGVVLRVDTGHQGGDLAATWDQPFRSVVTQGEDGVFLTVLAEGDMGLGLDLVIVVVHLRRILQAAEKGGGDLGMTDQG